MSKTNYTLDSLRNLVGQKDIYIYGAGPRGLIWYNYLTFHQFNITGFIDRSKKGKNIFTPDALKNLGKENKPFVIIAAQVAYARQIVETLEGFGFAPDKDYVNGSRLYNTFPTIEVAGVCNLRCDSCNLGSAFAGRKKGGLMSLDLYQKVFRKLVSDIPILPNLALFCWGEPLLNPELPEIIRFTQENGVAVELSTNLNYSKNLEKVVASSPVFIKVSCSGVGDHYERMHTGGKWSGFLENIRNLRKWMDAYNTDSKVEIVYHLYKHNLEDDFDQIKALADELGFTFYPIIANVFPESIYSNVVNRTPIPEKMMEVSREMIFSIEDQIQYSRERKSKKCLFMNAFPTIRWDGSVIPCCNMEGSEIAENYLEVPIDELKKRQINSRLCKTCLAHGLQRLCSSNCRIDIVDGQRKVIKL